MKKNIKKLLSVVLIMTVLMSSFAVIGLAADAETTAASFDFSTIVTAFKSVLALFGISSLEDMSVVADKIAAAFGGLTIIYEQIINSVDAASIVAWLLSLVM